MAKNEPAEIKDTCEFSAKLSNITGIAIEHCDSEELGQYLIALGQHVLDRGGLPSAKPPWLRGYIANHGGGPCAPQRLKFEIPIYPLFAKVNPAAKPKG